MLRSRATAIVLALAAVLAVGPWVAGAMAQVAPPPRDAVEHSRSQAPNGGGTDAAVQSSDKTGGRLAAQLRRRALEAMEMLREEIVTLTALREAQTALLAWNLESAKTGAPSRSLPGAVCEEPALAAWCRLLPATFGAPFPEEDHDGD